MEGKPWKMDPWWSLYFSLEDPTLSTWHQAVGTPAESCSLTELGCQRWAAGHWDRNSWRGQSHRQVIPTVPLTSQILGLFLHCPDYKETRERQQLEGWAKISAAAHHSRGRRIQNLGLINLEGLGEHFWFSIKSLFLCFKSKSYTLKLRTKLK